MNALQIVFGVVVWGAFAAVVVSMLGVALYRGARCVVRALRRPAR